MTERKITSALKRVEKFKKEGAQLQALIEGYHLNLLLIKYILSGSGTGKQFEAKKVKHLLREFHRQYSTSDQVRGVLTKSSFKTVKLWLEKMDVFFKEIKIKQPQTTRALTLETMQILNMLNISANKMKSNHSRAA